MWVIFMLKQHKVSLTMVCRGVGEIILFGVIAFCNSFMDSSSGAKLVLGIMFSSISKSNVDAHGKVSQ